MFSTSAFLPPPSDPRWIVVANLPQDANEAWLRMLFSPIGIVEVVELTSEGGCTAYLLFSTAEQAAASLAFNGFLVLGTTIQVRPRNSAMLGLPTPVLARPDSSPVSPMTRYRPNQAIVDSKPTHKNLYVLNLPLDASTDQLTALFATYGTVVHCVILAMLDAQARRRGFIDMSSPDEAKEAIEGLNGFVWRGYPIEVSYAIVQRSGGPFDQVTGRNIIKRNVPRNRFNTGPRRVPSDSAIGSNLFGAEGTSGGSMLMSSAYGLPGYPNNLPSPGYSEASSRAASERDDDTSSATDPFTIFLAGLDPVAIIDDDDFRTALMPYGNVTAATLCRDEHGTSRGFGIVTFAHQEEASRACENLNGKVINGRRLSAHKYVYQTQPSLLRASSVPQSLHGLTALLPTRPVVQAGRGTMPLSDYLFGAGIQGGQSLSLSPTTLMQQNPLVNAAAARLTPRSPHVSSAWPPSPHGPSPLSPSHRLDQIPMGAIGAPTMAGTLGIEAWSSSSTPLRIGPSFFKANGTSRAIEIKPDPSEMKDQGAHPSSKQLGDAFTPMPKSDATIKNECGSKDSSGGSNGEETKTGGNNVLMSTGASSYQSSMNALSLLRTPSSTNSPWTSSSSSSSSGGGVSGHGMVSNNSLNLDVMSPESTMSMTSSTSSSLSQLNTPVSVRGTDSTTIWGHSTSHDRMAASIRSAVSPGCWLNNSPPGGDSKRVNMSGSAILSLQNNDVVEKANVRGAIAMAPVGHEKSSSSSPMRVMRPFKEDGEVESLDI